MTWTLTTRSGPRVSHDHYETLDAAIDALDQALEELTPTASRDEVRFLARRIEPVQQVSARLELAGPRGSARGGVDLRGDGSAEAFTGRVRRRLIVQRDGESPAQALRRELAAGER